MCETCDVLFDAATALDAVDKARAWAADHTADSSAEFVGIGAFWTVQDERPDDGTEIAGRFFETTRETLRDEIPDPTQLSAVRLEGIDGRRPIRDILSTDAIRILKRTIPDDEQ